MSNRKINITTQLDFITDKTSIQDINKQIEAAVAQVKLNMDVDPKDRERAIRQLESFGDIAKKSFSKTSQRVNKQMLDAFMINSSDIAGWNDLDKTLKGFGVVGTDSFNDIKNANQLFNKEIVESENALDRMGQTLTNTIRWNISSKVVNSFTGAIQEAYYFAKDLDRELTNIQIVSGTSADEMARFADEANKSAKALGSTTVEYAKAATLFYQQGLRGDEVTDMTDAATIASNITREEISEMSNLLTSTMNGYHLATSEVMNVVDMMANVGANTAADFNELATAMSKVASMASSADVPMESLIAQLSTIISTTRQSPETVGTALKTVYGRMLAFKTDLDAIFEEDGEVFSAPKVEEAIQAFGYATDSQLTMFETAEDGSRRMRELGDILNDVGNAWDKTTDKSAKFALTTAMAGNRQQNNLVALFDSWDQYTDTVELALESEGTGLEQNEVHLDSYEGKLQQLQATKEELFMVLTDSEGMKNFIDLMIIGVEKSTELIEAAGGVSAIIGQLGGVLSSLVVPKGLDKLGEVMSSMSGGGVVPGPDYDAQIKSYREIQRIQRAFGKEEAEAHRQSIRQAEIQHKNSRVQKDLYDDELKAIRDAEEAGINRANRVVEDGRKIADSEKIIQEARSKSLQLTIEEREAQGHSVERLTHLKKLQEELSTITEKGQKLAGEQAKAVTEAGHNELAELENRAKEVEGRIDRLKGEIQQDVDTAPKTVDVAGKNLENQREKTAQVAQEASKRLRIETGINAALRIGIPLIATAKDTTAETNDLVSAMGVGLLSMLPQIISGVSEFMKLKSAMSVGSAFFSSALGPIAIAVTGITALVALIRKANKETRELEKATKDYEEALDLSDTHESNAESLRSEHEQVLENIREIEELENPTGEDSHRLSQYKQQNLELEQQIAHEEYLAEIERQRASEKAFEILGTSQESEYDYTMEDYSIPAQFDGDHIEGSIEQFKRYKDAMPNQELENLAKAHRENEEAMADQQRIMENLLRTTDENGRMTEKNTAKYDAASKKVKELENVSTDLSKELFEKQKAFEDMIKSLEPANEEEERLKEQYLKSMDAVRDYTNELTGLQQVREDGTIISAEEVRLLAEQQARYDEYIGQVLELHEALDDVNMTEGERLETLAELAEAMGNMLDMEISEDFFHQAENVDLLTQAIDGSELAWVQLQLNMLGSKADIVGLADQFNLSGEQITSIINSLDTLEFTADGKLDLENFKNNLTAMGVGIAEAEAMIKGLSQMEVAFELTEQDFEIGRPMEGIDMMSGAAPSVRTVRNLKGRLLTGLNKVATSNPFAGLNLGDSGGGGYTPKDTRKKKGGGRSPSGGGGGGGGSSAEQYRAEADAYAAINRELELNSTLMDRNNALQTNAGDDLEKKIKLMEEEVKLNEGRQKSLHKLNQQQRQEMKDLANYLAGQGFQFEGSGDGRRITDSSLGNIAGKSKEVEEAFNRFNELQGNIIPKISQEWWGLENSIQGVREAIKQANSQIVADRISASRDWISKRQYYDDWGADNEIAAWDRVENYIQDYYDKGKISYKEYSDYMLQIDRDRVAAQNKIYDEAQKKWIDSQNKDLGEQRDRLDALEDLQSIIVDMIRKRGEQEREIEQELHTKNMEDISERHEAKTKMYQEELDAYTEMVQGKIDALDDQWEKDDYLENLEREQRAAADIQKQIDIISLDDSLTARNKRVELEDQLSKQEEKIAKMQRDRERKELKDSLSEELKNKQESIKDKQDLADGDREREAKEEEKRHEEEINRLDKAYSNAAVYSEARQVLLKLEGKTAADQFDILSNKFEGFSKEFGEGMGILGGIIQKDFIDKLGEAQVAIENMEYLERAPDDYESDYKPTEDDKGWKDPLPPRIERRPTEFDHWGQEEYDEYIQNKKDWSTSSKTMQDALSKRNQDLREHYWGASRKNEDKYTAEELEKMRSYSMGGKIDYDGLAVVHGEKNPEWVLRDFHLQKIVKNAIQSSRKLTAPQLAEGYVSKEVKLSIENFIRADTITEDSQTMLEQYEEGALERLKIELNKVGI